MTDTATEQRDLARFRQQYYGLLARLLSREPPDDLLDALRPGIAERAAAARLLDPLLGEGWDHLAGVLPEITAEIAEQEFLRLFIGPFQPEVTPYESWYITGQLFQGPLIALRRFVSQIGLERLEAVYPEPEDALAFELEVMNWLVTRQLEANSPEEEQEWLHRQAAFLRHHLLIWALHCAQDLESAKSAVLYKGVGLLLRGLASFEKQRLRAEGVPDCETLEQARRRYGAPRAFQGPLFDPSAPPKPPGTPPSGEGS
jgi:TorA maturation chaperone TorD